MDRKAMQEKIKDYIMQSSQKLEVFTNSNDKNSYEIMNTILEEMTDIELENMCDRIDFEDEYDSYYEILRR